MKTTINTASIIIQTKAFAVGTILLLKIQQLSNITSRKVSPIESKDYPAKAPRPYYSVLNKSKIKQTFGIAIPHWEDGLKRCLKGLI